MKKSGVGVLIFQTVFFAVTTFILHFAFFEFWQSEDYESYIQNWIPVLILDLFVGVAVGLLNGLFSFLLNNIGGKMRFAIVLTDIIWLLFCVWWYFNNKGVINTEAVGHVISPFIVGFAGAVLALANLAVFLIYNLINRKRSI